MGVGFGVVPIIYFGKGAVSRCNNEVNSTLLTQNEKYQTQCSGIV